MKFNKESAGFCNSRMGMVWGNPVDTYRVRDKRLESSPAEMDLRSLLAAS